MHFYPLIPNRAEHVLWARFNKTDTLPKVRISSKTQAIKYDMTPDCSVGVRGGYGCHVSFLYEFPFLWYQNL